MRHTPTEPPQEMLVTKVVKPVKIRKRNRPCASQLSPKGLAAIRLQNRQNQAKRRARIREEKAAKAQNGDCGRACVPRPRVDALGDPNTDVISNECVEDGSWIDVEDRIMSLSALLNSRRADLEAARTSLRTKEKTHQQYKSFALACCTRLADVRSAQTPYLSNAIPSSSSTDVANSAYDAEYKHALMQEHSIRNTLFVLVSMHDAAESAARASDNFLQAAAVQLDTSFIFETGNTNASNHHHNHSANACWASIPEHQASIFPEDDAFFVSAHPRASSSAGFIDKPKVDQNNWCSITGHEATHVNSLDPYRDDHRTGLDACQMGGISSWSNNPLSELNLDRCDAHSQFEQRTGADDLDAAHSQYSISRGDTLSLSTDPTVRSSFFGLVPGVKDKDDTMLHGLLGVQSRSGFSDMSTDGGMHCHSGIPPHNNHQLPHSIPMDTFSPTDASLGPNCDAAHAAFILGSGLFTPHDSSFLSLLNAPSCMLAPGAGVITLHARAQVQEYRERLELLTVTMCELELGRASNLPRKTLTNALLDSCPDNVISASENSTRLLEMVWALNLRDDQRTELAAQWQAWERKRSANEKTLIKALSFAICLEHPRGKPHSAYLANSSQILSSCQSQQQVLLHLILALRHRFLLTVLDGVQRARYCTTSYPFAIDKVSLAMVFANCISKPSPNTTPESAVMLSPAWNGHDSQHSASHLPNTNRYTDAYDTLAGSDMFHTLEDDKFLSLPASGMGAPSTWEPKIVPPLRKLEDRPIESECYFRNGSDLQRMSAPGERITPRAELHGRRHNHRLSNPQGQECGGPIRHHHMGSQVDRLSPRTHLSAPPTDRVSPRPNYSSSHPDCLPPQSYLSMQTADHVSPITRLPADRPRGIPLSLHAHTTSLPDRLSPRPQYADSLTNRLSARSHNSRDEDQSHPMNTPHTFHSRSHMRSPTPQRSLPREYPAADLSQHAHISPRLSQHISPRPAPHISPRPVQHASPRIPYNHLAPSMDHASDTYAQQLNVMNMAYEAQLDHLRLDKPITAFCQNTEWTGTDQHGVRTQEQPQRRVSQLDPQPLSSDDDSFAALTSMHEPRRLIQSEPRRQCPPLDLSYLRTVNMSNPTDMYTSEYSPANGGFTNTKPYSSPARQSYRSHHAEEAHLNGRTLCSPSNFSSGCNTSRGANTNRSGQNTDRSTQSSGLHLSMANLHASDPPYLGSYPEQLTLNRSAPHNMRDPEPSIGFMNRGVDPDTDALRQLANMDSNNFPLSHTLARGCVDHRVPLLALDRCLTPHHNSGLELTTSFDDTMHQLERSGFMVTGLKPELSPRSFGSRHPSLLR